MSFGSMLTVGIELEFFAAMKSVAFDRLPHDTIADLLADRLRRPHLNGPEGTGAAIKAIPEIRGNSNDNEGVDYRCWTLITDPSVEPSHPEWFACCTFYTIFR